MDEIYAFARSSSQVVESKIIRLHRFRLLLGEYARSFRSKPKMDCSTRRISTVQIYRELFGIDGEPIEFEWNIFPGHVSLEIFRKINQKNVQDQDTEPDNLGRRIFMSMFNDMDWTENGNSEKFVLNSEQVNNFTKRFSRGHWSFLGPGNEEQLLRTHIYKLEGKWDSIATEMVGHFKETGHPVFKSISVLTRGILERKGGKCTTHFNADSSNTELLFRTIQPANQLSNHGAVSNWCEELAQWIQGQNELTVEKSVAKENEQLLKNVKPQEVNSLVQTSRSNDGTSRNRLREQLRMFGTLEKDIQFTRVCELPHSREESLL